MGTRADFYVGRGEKSEWLGSIAWDGYPEGIDDAVLKAKTKQTFRGAVRKFFKGRDDVTLPTQGWPWPWETSATTDYAYSFDGSRVSASCFGGPWFKPTAEQPDKDDGPSAIFPNMKAHQRVTTGKRSGIIVISGQ